MEVTLRTRKRQFWFSKTVTAALSTPTIREPSTAYVAASVPDLVHAQVCHQDGGRSEATDMVGKVEFNRAFPHDRNEDGGHGNVLEGSEKIVGGSRRKIFRDHMPGVPGFRCFFRAGRRVHHREPVSEGRVRDHHDNVGYLVVLKAIE